MICHINKAITNAPWGAECFLISAFEALGQRVVSIDYQQNMFELTKAIKAIDIRRTTGSIVQRGTGYNMPTSVIRLLPRPRILLLTELVFRVSDQSYLWSTNLFDFFYVRTPHCKDILEQRYGIPAHLIEVFLSAFDISVFFPYEEEKDINVLFVGAITPRRAEVLNDLKLHLGDRLVVTSAYARDFNRLINRSKIVLNIHGADQRDTETRIFEVLGAKAFLVTEPLSEESPFIDGKELIVASSITEMVEVVHHFLADSMMSARENIAMAGYSKVKAQHTYRQRALLLSKSLSHLRDGIGMNTQQQVFWKAQLDEWLLACRHQVGHPLVRAYHKIRTGK